MTAPAGELAVLRERAETAEAEVSRLRSLLERHGHAGEAREFLTRAETARRLNVHPATVLRMEKSGELAPVVTPGGRRQYRASRVEELRRRRRAGGTA